MMNILLISQNDISKDGRVNEMKRVLNHLGDVSIVSCTDRSPEPISEKVIFFHRKKILHSLSFLFFCKKTYKKHGPFDLLVADNRNCIFPVLFVKICCKCKYVLYDAREFYIFSEVKTLRSRIGCIIEKLFVSRFDVVTCANQFRADSMASLYKLNRKPIPFENIRKLEYSDLSEKECEQKYGNLFSDHSCTNIVTTSGEALIRRADILVSAVAKLGNRFRLFLIGYDDAAGHKAIESICKNTGWDNIVRYSWLSKSELKYIVSHSDIGIVNYSFQNQNNKFCASGKLYEFIFEGIPVVTTSNPPLSAICDEYKIGVSDDSFYNGIKEILAHYAQFKMNVKAFSQNIDLDKNAERVSQQIYNSLFSSNI